MSDARFAGAVVVGRVYQDVGVRRGKTRPVLLARPVRGQAWQSLGLTTLACHREGAPRVHLPDAVPGPLISYLWSTTTVALQGHDLGAFIWPASPRALAAIGQAFPDWESWAEDTTGDLLDAGWRWPAPADLEHRAKLAARVLSGKASAR
jgi:hypothetical protein